MTGFGQFLDHTLSSGETEPCSHFQQAVPPGKGCDKACRHLWGPPPGSPSPNTSCLDMRMRSPERSQSHVLPDPISAEICPQKDINGQQENSINVANSLPQGLFLDAGESPLQGSSFLLGQGGCGASGQTAEPQVQRFPAGRLGCCERWTKKWVLSSSWDSPLPPSTSLEVH